LTVPPLRRGVLHFASRSGLRPVLPEAKLQKRRALRCRHCVHAARRGRRALQCRHYVHAARRGRRALRCRGQAHCGLDPQSPLL